MRAHVLSLQDVSLKGAWGGHAVLELFAHALGNVAKLPVLNVLSGMHFVGDVTLGLGEVVHDYLARDQETPVQNTSSRWSPRNEKLGLSRRAPVPLYTPTGKSPCGLDPIPRALFGIGIQRNVGHHGRAIRPGFKDSRDAL